MSGTNARAIEIALTIPDNEARTALATLQRMGMAVAALERTELYRFDAEPAAFDAAVATVRTLETVFNPNKHALRVREEATPRAGEVWIDELVANDVANSRIGGRTLAGVSAVERFTAWRMRDERGEPSSPEVVEAATQSLLCNSAFQRATRLQ